MRAFILIFLISFGFSFKADAAEVSASPHGATTIIFHTGAAQGLEKGETSFFFGGAYVRVPDAFFIVGNEMKIRAWNFAVAYGLFSDLEIAAHFAYTTVGTRFPVPATSINSFEVYSGPDINIKWHRPFGKEKNGLDFALNLALLLEEKEDSTLRNGYQPRLAPIPFSITGGIAQESQILGAPIQWIADLSFISSVDPTIPSIFTNLGILFPLSRYCSPFVELSLRRDLDSEPHDRAFLSPGLKGSLFDQPRLTLFGALALGFAKDDASLGREIAADYSIHVGMSLSWGKAKSETKKVIGKEQAQPPPPAFSAVVGQIADRNGRLISADIEVIGSQFRAHRTSKDKFEMSLPSGAYTVKVGSPGYISQEIHIDVDTESRYILNLTLYEASERNAP